MAGQYGMSFAAKLIEEGKYAEAVLEADKAIARDDADPEARFERATAHAWLEGYAAAVADFEAALALDAESCVLETDVVDDAYFSALLGHARSERDPEAGVRLLERYRDLLPEGRHVEDVAVWSRRLRGEGMDAVIEKVRG